MVKLKAFLLFTENNKGSVVLLMSLLKALVVVLTLVSIGSDSFLPSLQVCEGEKADHLSKL